MSNAESSNPSRLDEIIAEYLASVEAGNSPGQDSLIAANQEIARELREFFADMQEIDKLAGAADDPDKTPFDVLAPTLPPSTELGAAASSLVGDKIHYFGDYQLLEEIARGGMGIVYKALQTKLKRTVALKMILAGHLASDEDIKRFYAEAESAASLEHPGIVPIHEVGQVGEQHFFSMAFVEGRSLAQVIQQGPLTAERAADYVGQIASAISYAHAKKVIHRDLKPANVLLDENGRVKVTDFGLAKQTHLDTGLTATGQIMGTPGYMPPEQATGNISLVDETSDIYSIGALFYCLLTGRPPFQAATPLETLTQVIEQDPVGPRALVPGIPRDLETICLKCLNKEKHRRYQSSAELAEEIERFENNQPILARRVSSLERAVRWMKRRSQPLWVATLTGFAVALCLVVGLIGRFAYQQSLLGYVDLQTNEEEGYLVATIFDEQQRQVKRQTLPTQQAIALPEGSYRIRLSGARRMSKDVQLEVERGSRRQPYSPVFSLTDTELWPTIQHEGAVEFLEFENRDDAILWDDQHVTRRNGASGQTIWQTDIAESLKTFDVTDEFRWWKTFSSTLNGQRSFRTSPRLLQPAVDLNRDGTRDLVFSGSEQAWLIALSGKNGKPLWFKGLAEVKAKRVNFGPSLLDSAVVHPPVTIADVDRDDIAEILTIVFDLGDDRQAPPRRWLELTSGKTGEQIWTSELDGAWFDEQNVPLDLRWLHSGSGGSNQGLSSSGGYAFSRDRQSSSETGANYYSTSPVLFITQEKATEITLLAGTRLVHVQPDTGAIDGVALGFTPIKTPEVADLDNDGSDEILFLRETNSKTQPTELIVWSTATNKIAWRKRLGSTWGAVRKLGLEIATWPYVADLNGDGQAEVLVPDFTTFEVPFTEKPYGGLSAFDANGNLIWEQKLVSMREQLDRFIAGPDINNDGWLDLFVVTDDARNNRGVWNQKAILVDAISGRDGERVWWNHQVLQSGNQDWDYGETLRWWNTGSDGWPQLLVGIESDLFAFSPRTGEVTGFGHFIDSILVADGSGDDLDDLFFLRKGNLGSYRGRPQINWMRPPMKIVRSADIDSDGIDDLVFGDKLVSGSNGKTRWSIDMDLGPAFNTAPQQQMFVLNHDINNDGFRDVLANCEWQRGRRHFAKLLSGKSGSVLWNARGDFSDQPVWQSDLIHVSSGVGVSGDVELTVIVSESKEIFEGSFYTLEPGHTWLVRLDGKSGKPKWKVPLFADQLAVSGFDVVHKDLNNDGVQDVLTAANTTTDSAGRVTKGKLQLRAFDGRDGSVIWKVPVVQLDDNSLGSFPRLTVADTHSDGVVVVFYDHQSENGTTARLRVINGATGNDKSYPLNWTDPIPKINHNQIQLPWPIVIQDRNKGEHFFAFSVWTRNPGVTTGWNGEGLEKGIVEEFVMINAEGKIVTRFGLPRVRGNRFLPNRQRLWTYDTNQDGVDELIFLDQTGLSTIDPFSSKLVWSWARPRSLDLRLHSIIQRPDTPDVGVVYSNREAFGIDLSNGTEIWFASDKNTSADQWPSREDIHVLNCEGRNPRILFLNDKETVCITPRSTGVSPPGDSLPVPYERMARNDPRNFRYLPWVEEIPFVHRPDPMAVALEQAIGLLVCLPMLFLFFVVPWFWGKHVINQRRFSIRSLFLLIVLVSVGALFFAPQSSFVPEQFKFSYENMAIGLGIVLPPAVFAYSAIRMLLLGQWKSLKWVSVVTLVLAGVFAIAAMVAVRDFAPEEAYSYDYSWTLILWLVYLIGLLLIVFEGARICWNLVRFLVSKLGRKKKRLAAV